MVSRVLQNIVAFLVVSSVAFAADAPVVTWTMINVNSGHLQGDAHLLEFRDGQKILIDAGNAENALVNYFAKHKITELSEIIITHAHRDHYQGVPDLVAAGVKIKTPVAMNFPSKVQCDAEAPWGCDWAELEKLKNRLGNRRVLLVPYARGKRANGHLEVRDVFTHATSPIANLDVNSMSPMIWLRAGKFKVLFTGDLNSALSDYLAKQKGDLKADILKAPHHGGDSMATNSFFDRVGARVTLVPGPKWLWEDNRSKRFREYVNSKKMTAFVNGLHGNIRVEFFKDFYRITSDQGPEFVWPPGRPNTRPIAD